MSKCTFCRWARNGISANGRKKLIVAEDRLCFTVLDDYPLMQGHMLVISKSHYTEITKAPVSLVRHMFEVSRRLATATTKRLGAIGFMISTNSGETIQSEKHFHIHIIPQYKGKVLTFDAADKRLGRLDSEEERKLAYLLGQKSNR